MGGNGGLFIQFNDEIDRRPSLSYLPQMSIKPIITLPDEKILRQRSAALQSVDEAARKLFNIPAY